MFLICGEALFDVFVGPEARGDATPGYEDGSAVTLQAVAGGSPYNVAIGLARLGQPSALCTELALDRLGRRLASVLDDEGVDLCFAHRSTGATALALVDIDATGTPRYGFHGLRQMRLHPSEEIVAAQGERISGIHVGSFCLVSERSADPLLALISNRDDVLVSLDPNVRLAIEPDIAVWRRQIDLFRRQAHLIKTSLEDLEAIYGAEADLEQIAESWLGGRTSIVVLTRGARGGLLFAQGQPRIAFEATATKVVDTVGAGDTYQAALLCWLAEAGLPSPIALKTLTPSQLDDMARFASQAAALTCARRGPDLPRRSDLDAAA